MKIVLNVALSLSLLAGTTVPSSPLSNNPNPTVETSTPKRADKSTKNTVKDGIHEHWSIDPQTKKGNETLAIEDGWLHFKAGAENGNSASSAQSYPAMLVNDATFDFNSPGSFTTTLKSKNGAANDRFGIYLGYNTPGNGLFFGYDPGGWFWQKYQNGNGDYYGGTRVPGPVANTETKVKIVWDENHKAKLIVNDQVVFDNIDFSGLTMSNRIGIKAGTYGTQYTDVYLKNMDYTGLDASVAKYALQGVVQDDANQPVANAKVSIGDHAVYTDASGHYSFDQIFIPADYTLTISKSGYHDQVSTVTVANTDVNVGIIKLTAITLSVDTIQSADMKVEIYKDFPAVRKYDMTSVDHKVLYGQIVPKNTVAINGVNIDVDASNVTYTKTANNTAQYTLHVENDAQHINADISVQIRVDSNKLFLDVTKIKNNLQDATYPIQSIAFPDQSIISVQSNQAGASFTGSIMSSDTNRTGDETVAVKNGMAPMNNKDYMYSFLSDNELSAGMWSNSEHDGRAVASVAGGGTNTRMYATTDQIDNYTSLGLASAPWYYHREVKDSKGRSYVVPQTDMPKMAVVITGDENDDHTINWEDGAIAFRGIMNNPVKSQEVPELVSYRIAMNFGSQAQNPFLTTLDNVKKVALNTDGLGQSVLLKGYANEGHDSGHPDYWDIGKRMGGVKDFNTLLTQGKKYGARFGVHVNASEMYPEAKSFSEDMIRRTPSGGLRYGWNWLDQSVGIDGIYDLASGARDARFAKLKAEVGNNLDFIYVDVWGNQTSGNEDSWETRKLSKMITDKGWRMANEWGAANEYDATFQHWAADLTYGGSGMKGENSQVMRFLRNHQKDSWDGDYPSYGGAANAPLLGGYSMKDFEGWQGRNDYDAYINNLYTHDVSTKFIQHFTIISWLNNPLDATAPKDASVNNGNEEITLKDDFGNTVVLTRGSNNTSSPDYRKRTMTLNGKVVLDGHVSKGDETGKGDESYLLPWNWDVTTGKFVSSSKEKLYHWNTKGGTTTWDLPDDWQNLSTVKVYTLTDLGKTDEKSVPVKNGKITLTALAETPYVVCKGNEQQIPVDWSTGMHIVDASFNSGEAGLKKNWSITGKGSASVAKSQYSNPMLKTSGDVALTQKLSDLTPGKEYAMYLGVDNRSSGKAMATISANGKVIGQNYTNKSIAQNYVKAYTHNTNSATVDGNSYFQNMYVFFTAPSAGNVTLTLSHAGSGDAYFDDVRVVENNAHNITYDSKGNVETFTNDFENNAQGIYPFVVAGSEGVEDNRIHLSELHAPFTQAGWDTKKMDDVLGGNWSVKINGLTQKNALVYQTIPQNIRFEPGSKYKISFDYQAGSDGTYAVAIGNGPYGSGNVELHPLKKALGTTSTYTFDLTGSLSGDTWFGIYSTSKPADVQGTTGSASDFGGYKDFILDNVKVAKENETIHKSDAEALLQQLLDPTKYAPNKFSQDAWKVYDEVTTQANVLIHKDQASEDDYTSAYKLLRGLKAYMETAPGSESDAYYDVATNAYTVQAGSEQPETGNEGPVAFAQDNKPDTWWHTNWGDTNLNNAWYEFDLKKPTTIDGLRYLPRQGGDNTNGKIKSYDLILTSDDGVRRTQHQITIPGTFDTATKWQKKAFDPVKNVVKVRLKVNASAGSSADQVNHFASAAELRLTTPKDAPKVTVDKAKLATTLQTAQQLQAKEYTAGSWNTLQVKLNAAMDVKKDAHATQYAVDLATTNLQTAMDGLVRNTPLPVVDKTNLNTAIQNAKGIDVSKYTKDSVHAMQIKLNAAIAVQSNDNATQEQVNTATDDLVKAMASLQLSAAISKDDLSGKLNEAIETNKKLYTSDSYKALTDAMAQAKKVIGDPNASQTDINNAYLALDRALRSLVTVDSVNSAASTTNAVSTGDTTSLGGLCMILLISGGIVYIAIRQKRKQEKLK